MGNVEVSYQSLNYCTWPEERRETLPKKTELISYVYNHKQDRLETWEEFVNTDVISVLISRVELIILSVKKWSLSNHVHLGFIDRKSNRGQSYSYSFSSVYQFIHIFAYLFIHLNPTHRPKTQTHIQPQTQFINLFVFNLILTSSLSLLVVL